jgi:hypothetical protein
LPFFELVNSYSHFTSLGIATGCTTAAALATARLTRTVNLAVVASLVADACSMIAGTCRRIPDVPLMLVDLVLPLLSTLTTLSADLGIGFFIALGTKALGIETVLESNVLLGHIALPCCPLLESNAV